MKSQYVRVSHWARHEGGWVVVAASCIAIPVPCSSRAAGPGQGTPPYWKPWPTPTQSKDMLAAQNLQRAQQCAEGIWNLYKPFLLAEKFVFFTASANTC